MKPVINSNKHQFINWLKNNPIIIFKWFTILLILIIANVFTWSIPVSVADRLFGCVTVTIVIGIFASVTA